MFVTSHVTGGCYRRFNELLVLELRLLRSQEAVLLHQLTLSYKRYDAVLMS